MGIRFFQGKWALELNSERLKMSKNALFEIFPHILSLNNFSDGNFCIQQTPFGVNLYLELPQ
jgi:hypothetical protein